MYGQDNAKTRVYLHEVLIKGANSIAGTGAGLAERLDRTRLANTGPKIGRPRAVSLGGRRQSRASWSRSSTFPQRRGKTDVPHQWSI